MTTAMPEFDTEVLDKIADAPDGAEYKALDLISEFSTRSESDVQRAIAKLLRNGRIVLTLNRTLKKS